MKTKLTLALLLLSVTYVAHAQFPPYYFGLKASPQICWMKPNVDNYENSGAKAGFSWGFIAEMNFTENHSIGTGFNMLFNGGKLKLPAGDTGTVIRNYSLKYIEFPLTLKMRTNPIKGIRYFGRIGLGTAFKVGSKKTDEITTKDGKIISLPKTTNDKISFVRESLIVGLGGEYEINEGPKIGVELAFNNGFTNILTDKNAKAIPNFFELTFSVLF